MIIYFLVTIMLCFSRRDCIWLVFFIQVMQRFYAITNTGTQILNLKQAGAREVLFNVKLFILWNYSVTKYFVPLTNNFFWGYAKKILQSKLPEVIVQHCAYLFWKVRGTWLVNKISRTVQCGCRKLFRIQSLMKLQSILCCAILLKMCDHLCMVRTRSQCNWVFMRGSWGTKVGTLEKVVTDYLWANSRTDKNID